MFYRSFDKENTGKISEKVFKQIMLGKGDVSEADIDEMLQEYYRLVSPHPYMALDSGM